MKTIEIDIEFQVGDRVWIILEHISEKWKWITCKACGGVYTREVDGYLLKCTNCASGNEWDGDLRLETVEGVVTGVRIEINRDRTDVKYIINRYGRDGSCNTYSKENIYRSREQAVEAIKDRTNENDSDNR
jgi:hypothetical protein